MEQTKPTEYTLDFDLWRCGDAGEQGHNALGTGATLMLNKEGFMCCLGQFAAQKGVDAEHLVRSSCPSIVFQNIGRSYDQNFLNSMGGETDLTDLLMIINDNPNTTLQEKVAQIRTALNAEGITLHLKNHEKYGVV